MFLSLVFSVMAIGSAMANDSSAVADAKPKNVYVSINVPPAGPNFGRPCPPPPPAHKCNCKHCKKSNHNCCAPVNHCNHKHGKPEYNNGKPGGKPGGNPGFNPHGKPGGKRPGYPGGAPVGRPGGDNNHAPGRK